MTYISVVDFFLVPLYLIIIYYIAYKIRNKYYPEGHTLRAYFIPGLTAKIFASLAICFVYIYYFGYGDTLAFFYNSTVINASFSDSPATWFRLITYSANQDNLIDGLYLSLIDNYQYLNNFIVSIIGAIIGSICFNRFLCVAIIIASIAYSGLWALFRTFVGLYPTIIKQCAIAALFIPSVLIWGSGLFKDTVCIFALGWIFFSFYNLLNNKKIIVSIIILSFTTLLIFSIKAYIIIAVLPLLIIRVILGIVLSVKNVFKKALLLFLIGVIFIISFTIMLSNISENISEILLDNITQTITTFSNATQQISAEYNGSGYNLGEIDGTVAGLAKKIPAAINVTLFRPYIWEAGKSITFIAALESLTLLCLTIYVILKSRFSIIKYILGDANLLIFLLFSFIFAYMVGITTSNFGTLSRFKIPCIPFFTMSLFIINHLYNTDNIKTKAISEDPPL